MSFLLGPVNYLGHPFTSLREAPIRREIGGHVVYAFGGSFLYSKLRIEPDEPVEAILAWDPGWMRDGSHPAYKTDEIGRLREMADEWDCPIFGLASDWFATWGAGGNGMYGMMPAFKALDGVVIDPVGAATLRGTMPHGAVDDPRDYRHRPIVELSPFLHAGRLPTMGVEDPPDVPPLRDRDIDVCMVSSLYPGLVVHRSYYVEAARRICDSRGWTFVHRTRVSPEDMEAMYLNSKIVLNVSLGTQPNCRVFEALACGAILVTDGWNVGTRDVPAYRFSSADELEMQLEIAMEDVHRDSRVQRDGLEWARRHSPVRQWTRVLDAVKLAAATTAPARAARRAWQEEMDLKAASAPRTRDGRPVILV